MDEDSVICDLAETYGIFDYRGLSPKVVGALVFGLSDDSRIKRKISGNRYTSVQLMMARMIDELSFISWSKTDDAAHGRNRPKSLLSQMLDSDKGKELDGFSSGDDFIAAWKNLTESENKNG